MVFTALYKLHIMCYYKSRITMQLSRKLKIYKNIVTNLKTTDLIGLNSQGVFKNKSIYKTIFKPFSVTFGP